MKLIYISAFRHYNITFSSPEGEGFQPSPKETLNKENVFIRYRQISLIVISVFFCLGLSPAVLAQSVQPSQTTSCYRTVRGISAQTLTSLENLIKRVSGNKDLPLKISSCGTDCFQINCSLTALPRIIQIDSTLNSPVQEGQTLTIPPLDKIDNPITLDNRIRRLLIGHELHPYTSSSSQINNLRPAQQMAIEDFKESLDLGYDSFLHVSTTGTGKGLVLAKNLLEKMRRKSAKKISFITVDKIKIVDQLASEIQSETQEADFDLRQLHWIAEEKKDFSKEVRQALSSETPTVISLSISSFRIQMKQLKNEKPSLYEQLLQDLDGIYMDEVHHLGAPKTLKLIFDLKEKSKAFLYGATATPVHTDVIIQDLFQKVHWSYLEEVSLDIYPPSLVINQLGLSIERGDITPFNDIYTIFAENIENTTRTSFFIQDKENLRFFIQDKENLRFFINPHYYGHLREILSSIFKSNKKGMIIASTIKEAESLAAFFNKTAGITFEPYHSGMKPELKEAVFKNSREKEAHYIVAVRALDEGVNLPHLSAYIDLNSHVSVKQIVHRIGRVLRPALGKLKTDIFILSSVWNFEKAKELMNSVQQIREIIEDSTGQKMNSPLSPARKKLRDLANRSDKFFLRKEKFWSRKSQKNEEANRTNDNSLNSYFNYLVEMKRLYPPLSPERQYLLFKEFKKTGDVKIRNELVSRNFGFVATVANRYKKALPPSFDMMDLIQEGNEGLIKAVENYNPDLGYKFSTFAFHYIRKNIARFCVEQSHPVKVSNYHYRVFFNLERQKEWFFSQNKDFDAELVAENLSTDKETISPKNVDLLNNHLSQEITSFNQSPAKENEPTKLVEENPNPEGINSFEEIYDRERVSLDDLVAAEQALKNFKEVINSFLSSLPPRKKDILIKRIFISPKHTREKLAKFYNLSMERIRQIENKLLRELQRELLHPSALGDGLPMEVKHNLYRKEMIFNGSSIYVPSFSQANQTVQLLNSYTETIYGVSFLEYLQADHIEAQYPIPSSLPPL